MTDNGASYFQRQVAPNVRERHTRACARSAGRARCTCTPRYLARVHTGGIRYTETFGELADAIAWQQRVRDGIRIGHTAPNAPPTLETAARSFVERAREGVALTRSRQRYAANTLLGYERALRLVVLLFVDPVRRRPLGDLTLDEIDARVIQRLVDTSVPGTGSERVRAAAAALSAVLRDAYSAGAIDTLPPKVLLPAPSPGRTRVLTPSEFDRLLDAARRDDHGRQRSLLLPMIALLGASGCRVTEILTLRWGSDGVDLTSTPARLVIAREHTKTNAGQRTVYLDSEITRILHQHRLAIGNPGDGALAFPGSDGEATDRGGALRVGLVRTSRAAGIARVTPHVLRHSHATWAANANVPLTALAARLGHADPSFTLRRYAHASQAAATAIPDAILRHRRAASAADAKAPPAPRNNQG